jgi:gallate dioxygenase
MTGIATAIYENEASYPAAPDRAYLAHIGHQLAGVEKLEGSYPYTLARSVKGYRLNKFLHGLTDPARRARFRADQEVLFEESGLTSEERRLVRTLDWRGMIHYGVSFFMLEKLGAVVGVSNLHIYAAMRGQTLEEFQRTRNAPGALYSVAGNEAAGPERDWDTPAAVGAR